jgi:protein gp37
MEDVYEQLPILCGEKRQVATKLEIPYYRLVYLLGLLVKEGSVEVPALGSYYPVGPRGPDGIEVIESKNGLGLGEDDLAVKRSGISYVDFSGGDANFIIGCTKISEGCKNCYAHHLIATRFRQDFEHIRISLAKLRRLRRADFSPGEKPFVRGEESRPIVFPVDLGDLFHEDVPSAVIEEAFGIFADRSDVDWLILTKRTERMALMVPYMFGATDPATGIIKHEVPDNIWCGTTIEHPKYYSRIHELTKIQGLRWLSLEPMLAPMSNIPLLSQMHWVVVGAESGPNRREFKMEWAVEMRNLCAIYGTDFYFKQDSGLYPGANPYLEGKKYFNFPM